MKKSFGSVIAILLLFMAVAFIWGTLGNSIFKNKKENLAIDKMDLSKTLRRVDFISTNNVNSIINFYEKIHYKTNIDNNIDMNLITILKKGVDVLYIINKEYFDVVFHNPINLFYEHQHLDEFYKSISKTNLVVSKINSENKLISYFTIAENGERKIVIFNLN